MKKQFNKLVSTICLREGKKSQAKVHHVREILKVLQSLCKDEKVFMELVKYLVKEKR